MYSIMRPLTFVLLLLTLISSKVAFCESNAVEIVNPKAATISIDNFSLSATNKQKFAPSRNSNIYATNSFKPSDKIYFIISYPKKKNSTVKFDLEVKDSQKKSIQKRSYHDRKNQKNNTFSVLKLPFCAFDSTPGKYVAVLKIQENNKAPKYIEYPFLVS